MRNKILLCISMLSVAAISLCIASVGNADTFHYGPKLSGAQVGINILKTTGGSGECSTVAFTGTAKALEASEVMFTPTYSGCLVLGVAGEVNMNGCAYAVTIGVATTGAASIICPEGKEIMAKSAKCTFHIKAQEGIGTITYKNVSPGGVPKIEAELNLTGISYAHTQGTGIGKCTTGNGTTGTYGGIVLVEVGEVFGVFVE